MTEPQPPSGAFDFNAVLQSGDHIAWPQGTGEPTGLTAALMQQAQNLPRCTLVLGMVSSSTLSGSIESFDFLCLNGAGATRKATAISGNRVIPGHVSSLPGLISTRTVPIDVALIKVRPSDQSGLFSLSIMVDYVHEMIAAARVVIAEIDESLPITAGDVLIPASAIDHFTVADAKPVEMPDPTPTEADLATAREVAGIIPNGATVQFGVGNMPVAVCQALAGHQHLGLHSGVISDAVIDLIERGVIDNSQKGIDPGVSITGGLFGTNKLNAFAHSNSAIQLKRANYTHVASSMSQLNQFHTINSAVAIDLSGQVNAESAGGRYVGAVGGQVDFVRGARMSPGGRSIIAMTSTTPNVKHSKIVCNLNQQPVTTARSDIDLVVTEYGVADLWGKDLIERAQALINIAHPDFRDQLNRELAAQKP